MDTATSAPRVPWNPQPIEQLRARYPAAVKETIDVRDILTKRRATPSGEPEHVFDLEPGLRLIVSLERMPDGVVGVHISASFQERERVEALAGAGDGGMVGYIVGQWRALAQSDRLPTFLGISPGGIPHFFVVRAH